MEGIDVSSANSLAVDERLLLRSFMQVRKRSGPKIEHSIQQLILVTMKIIDHSKEYIEICNLKNF